MYCSRAPEGRVRERIAVVGQQFVIIQFRESRRRSMQALLMSGSEVIALSETINDLGFICAIVSVPEGRAENQADRFGSGLVGAHACSSLEEAIFEGSERFGVDWATVTVPTP